MEWIKVTDKLPGFNQRVLWRGVLNWRNEKDKYSYFDDELTNDEEILGYGQTVYLLKDNSDYLVSQHPNINEILDEFVTHWMLIPTI